MLSSIPDACSPAPEVFSFGDSGCGFAFGDLLQQIEFSGP
jgi:hypothetical protein